MLPGQFLGSSNLRRYQQILKIPYVATYKSEVWEQNCVWLFHYFHFGRNYDISKSKSPCFLLNKNINFNKNETESKIENPTHNFKETNLVLQFIQEWEIKSKTVMSWTSQKKKAGIFYTVYFFQRKFFLTFVFYLNI